VVADTSVKSIWQTFRSGIKSGIIYYYLAAILAIIYMLIVLSPIFRFFFIQDDLVMFDLGAILKRHPLTFLTFTYCGWWRLIGFTGAAWLYQFFGLNPYPYHVASFLIHLSTAITLGFLARRLFNLRVGLLAFIFFITSTISVNSVGFVSTSFQDGPGAAFIMLAMLVSIRTDGVAATRRGPYFGAMLFLFLSAACKESWIAYIPVAIYIDFMNYHKSKFWRRIFRLSPLLLVFSMFYFKFEFGGNLALEGPFNYFTHTFGLDNLLWGATLPFIPFGVVYDKFYADSIGDWLRLVAPVGLFALAWLWKKDEREKIGLLLVAFLSFLLVLGGALLNNGLWGWTHFPILVAVAAMVLAVLLQRVINRFSYLGVYLAVFILLSGYCYLQYYTIKDNTGDLNQKSRLEMISIRSFQSTAKDLVPGDVLVSFGGPTDSLVIDALIPKGVEFIRVFNKAAGGNMNEFLASPMDYVRWKVGNRALSPKTYYTGQVDGVFKDYTNQVKLKIATEINSE